MKNENWFLSQDNSSHWYVVPRAKQSEWEAWQELDENDPASWECPEYATRVGGSPDMVTFTSDGGFTID